MYVGIYSSFRIAWIGGCLASVAFSNESTYKRFVDEGREADFDRRFEDSVIEVRREFGKRHPIYIDGKERFCSDVLEERSPIDGAIIGYFQKGTREDARLAIGSSKAAFEAWRGIGYRERAAIMVRAAEIFRERKFRVSAILSIENGKSRYESMGEVDEIIAHNGSHVELTMLHIEGGNVNAFSLYGYVLVRAPSSSSRASHFTTDLEFVALLSICIRPRYDATPLPFDTLFEIIFEVVFGARWYTFPPES